MTATSSPPLSITMTAASSPSPLDKPLHLLTEDDISQVTREQCRNFLTRKGMRRPSWNKSQAIQQVIMLKALIEPVPECDDVSRKLHNAHRKHHTLTTAVQKVTSADTEVSVSADDSVPGQRDEIDQSDVARDDDFVSLGITSMTEEEKGQMTIFYSGKVNVYNEVPAEKAWTLLQLAASPLQFPPEAPFDGTGPPACHLQAACIRASTGSSAMILPTLQTAEGSASRKASVHRYLEKKKDRFKSKRKAESFPCASLDAHLSQSQNQNEQTTRSSACSPPSIRSFNTPNRYTK